MKKEVLSFMFGGEDVLVVVDEDHKLEILILIPFSFDQLSAFPFNHRFLHL